ncbi:MAG: hypothetical protein ABS54_13490 [Hyphomicrobium sp. SCN 65-11]|mgnify:FL=1|nr:MAG: hypothetical protein ABS54_13490 [Hyphomicrobium sp. SCN 65-11]
MSSRTSAKSVVPGSAREFGRRHGNAASASAYGEARDIVRGAEQAKGALPPTEMPPRQATSERDWFPRTRTAEELRARFQDGQQIGTHAAWGNPVNPGGRRLTDFDLDEQEERLRMPEPMPTSWLSPIQPQPPSAIMRHVTGAALGLTVGLALSVPVVLWQKGRIDPVGSFTQMAANFGLAVAAPTPSASVATSVHEPVAETPRALSVTAPPPVTATAVPGTIMVPVEAVRPAQQRPATASAAVAVLQPVAVETTPVQSEAAKAEAMLDDARRLISDGDFRTARSLLEDQTVAAMPAARFLLAETYDPNFLAARGVRSVRAEVPKAIELYREALDGGIEAARQRISALRP